MGTFIAENISTIPAVVLNPKKPDMRENNTDEH